LIVTHANADPDAVASALLLLHALGYLGLKDVHLAFPEKPSRLSRKILAALDLRVNYLARPEPKSRYPAVAVVDATNGVQLSAFRGVARRAETLLVVDHHVPPGDLLARARYAVVAKEPATVVLLVRAIEGLGVKIEPPLATLALTGLLFDSRRFIHVTPLTLRAAAYLLECGGHYERALSLLEEEPTYSERVAKLKGALRSHLLKVGEYIVAVSEIGSFEASVARALVALGADVALVASERDGECRLAVRVSRSFLERTKLSAGKDIAAKIAGVLGGEGGGHDSAGSYKGRCRASDALRAALEEVVRRLGERPRPLR